MYFYFPDSPHVNLTSLKKEIETIFTKADLPINFQPFSHRVDLEKQLIAQAPSFLFVPEGFALQYQDRFNINPLLHSLRNGSMSYEKILLYSSRPGFSLDKLSGSTIAMTKTEPNGYGLLDNLFKDNPSFDSSKIRIINVPKDADAIFALSLGQVDLALVSKVNLKLMEELSPHLRKQIKHFPQSIQVPMPVLCVMGGSTSSEKIAKLHEVLQTDQENLSQKLNLGILQINGWKIFID